MENMLFAGFRIGACTFNQTRINYSIYDVNNQYWGGQYTVEEGEQFTGLTALWAELLIGLNAGLFNNFFAGVNLQLKFLISEPDNYENLNIPA